MSDRDAPPRTDGPQAAAEAAPGGLDDLSRTALELAGQMPGPLQSLRVRSGEAAIEVEWPSAAPPAAAPPAPLAPQAPPATHPGPPDAEAADAGADQDLSYVCSPMVGTFYHAPEPGAAPFVSVGDTVTAGQQVGIIEAMKLMNRLDADTDGRVVEFLVADGTAVEYGQRLIACAPLDDA